MTPEQLAGRLITRHGCTQASDRAGRKVRAWATLAAFPCAGRVALDRLRHWLAVDWHLHHNPNLPED